MSGYENYSQIVIFQNTWERHRKGNVTLIGKVLVFDGQTPRQQKDRESGKELGPCPSPAAARTLPRGDSHFKPPTLLYIPLATATRLI